MQDVTKPAKSAAELKKLIAEEFKKIADCRARRRGIPS